jgi:hypothetical protein
VVVRPARASQRCHGGRWELVLGAGSWELGAGSWELGAAGGWLQVVEE